jgi:hypothetical protein
VQELGASSYGMTFLTTKNVLDKHHGPYSHFLFFVTYDWLHYGHFDSTLSIIGKSELKEWRRRKSFVTSTPGM